MKFLTKKNILTVSSEQLIGISFVLYFSMPLFKMIIGFIYPIISNYAAIALTYLPLLLVAIFSPGRIKAKDFVILLLLILLFFLLSYLIHPEYGYWYARDYYGAWDYVLRPDNGIFAYLFLRQIKDPKKILYYLLISSWLMFIRYGIDYLGFVSRGYWLLTSGGSTYRASYNLSFGYDLLLYELVFLYSALREKRLIHWIMAGIGVLMIITGGSRGPVADILIFIVLYFLFMLKHSRKKTIVIVLVVIAGLILYFEYVPIIDGLTNLLAKAGIRSRFLRMLRDGTVSDDNGRRAIWSLAVKMIKENPLGYGAMGARHRISELIEVGHPHNFFLEIWIDYGILAGTAILLTAAVSVLRLLRRTDIREWQGLLLVFLGLSSQLLFSGTYWHRVCVWGLFAVCMNIRQYLKERRSGNE